MVEDNIIQKTGRLGSVVFDHTTPVMQAVRVLNRKRVKCSTDVLDYNT